MCKRELTEFLAELTEFAAELSEFSSPKQYSRNSIPQPFSPQCVSTSQGSALDSGGAGATGHRVLCWGALDSMSGDSGCSTECSREEEHGPEHSRRRECKVLAFRATKSPQCSHCRCVLYLPLSESCFQRQGMDWWHAAIVQSLKYFSEPNFAGKSLRFRKKKKKFTKHWDPDFGVRAPETWKSILSAVSYPHSTPSHE